MSFMPGEDIPRPVVLFVDDEERVLRSLQRTLMDEPLDTRTAISADEALEVLAAEKVDAVVSDERMPGMKGSELLAEVRRLYPDVCRIMLTGHARLDAAIEAINEGRIFRFLLKPVSREELVSVINDCLQERKEAHKMLALSQMAGNVCSFELHILPGRGLVSLRWSENVRSLLQLPQDVALDSLDPLFDRLHPDDADEVREKHAQCLQDYFCPQAEFRIVLPQGEQRWLSQTSDSVYDHESGAVRLFSVLKDITEHKRQQQQLEHQAYHDVLTGLGNRACLLERLESFLQQQSEGRVAVVFLDLDDFKLVNDSMGHTFGDWLLQEFAGRLEENAPAGAVATRLGGDEFALALPGVASGEEALALARKVISSLEAPFNHGEYEFFVSASVGIALAQGADTPPLELLRDADTAMYEAKAGGKGSALVFHTGMHDKAAERFQLVSDMHRALQRDEFHLAFQPIVRLETLAVAGFEALCRWNHPVRGEVLPDVFIPIAEESGLITGLGMQVLEKALRQGQEWAKDWPGAPPFMSFNVSVQQLHQADLVARLNSALEQTGMEQGQVKVEITESGVMDDVELSMRVMQQLQDLGVLLQIDDFGTGYSSLTYLQRIPADSLKVDKTFVMGMEADEDKQAIVRTVLDLSRSLKLSVVAEGIETLEQLRMLQELGCEYGQGYLFDKPLPPQEAAVRRDYSHLLAGEAGV